MRAKSDFNISSFCLNTDNRSVIKIQYNNDLTLRCRTHTDILTVFFSSEFIAVTVAASVPKPGAPTKASVVEVHNGVVTAWSRVRRQTADSCKMY